MSLIPFPYNLIGAAVLAVAVAGGIAWTKGSYDEGKRAEGDARTHKVLDPLLEEKRLAAESAQAANGKLVADLRQLSAAVSAQNAEVERYEAAALVAQQAAQKALAEVARSSQRYAAEVTRLTALATAPKLTTEDCNVAKTILADLARASRDSVRDDAD